MRSKKRWSVAALLGIVVAVWMVGSLAWSQGVALMSSPAPAPDLSKATGFDLSDYAYTVRKYVSDDGLVDYAGLKKDRARLDRFVALLAVAGPETKPAWFKTREAKLAYYLNAYNALTLFQVVQRLPDFTAPYEDKATFWVVTQFALDSKKTNLNALENELIRPRFLEPRVHFALNCASMGCPKLPREPFVGDKLEAQLQRETTRFLAEERNVAVKGDALVLSQIFEWYGGDFSGGPEKWVRARRKDLPPTKRVEFRPYDWALNKQ
jgi:hypothetical protein